MSLGATVFLVRLNLGLTYIRVFDPFSVCGRLSGKNGLVLLRMMSMGILLVIVCVIVVAGASGVGLVG